MRPALSWPARTPRLVRRSQTPTLSHTLTRTHTPGGRQPTHTRHPAADRFRPGRSVARHSWPPSSWAQRRRSAVLPRPILTFRWYHFDATGPLDRRSLLDARPLVGGRNGRRLGHQGPFGRRRRRAHGLGRLPLGRRCCRCGVLQTGRAELGAERLHGGWTAIAGRRQRRLLPRRGRDRGRARRPRRRPRRLLIAVCGLLFSVLPPVYPD